MGAAGRAGRRLGAAAQVVLVAAILVVANFLASRHFARLDFTADRRYTLAPASRKALKGLKDIVNVEVYFSAKLPPYLVNLRTAVRDVLDEYRAWGGRNFQVCFITPEDDPATQQKLRMLGIPQLQLNVLEKDRFQVTQVYMGLAVLYGGRKEVIPVLQDTDQLEYQLTGAVLKITRDAPIKVAMSYPVGIAGLRGGREGRYGILERELGRQYEYAPYDPGEGAAVPADVSALVVAGAVELSAADLYRLDQYVMRGGKLILLADAVEMDGTSLGARPAAGVFGRLLKAWGVDVPAEVVMDHGSPAPASFSTGFMRLRIPYVFWPEVRPEGFDKDNPIVSRLDSLVMPWTSPVRPAAGKPAGLAYTVLAKSSPSSTTQAQPFDFTPPGPEMPPGGGGKSEPLALLVSGAFDSAFTADGPPEAVTGEEKASFLKQGFKNQVIVAGNARFVQDEFVGQFPGNGLFLMNAVDWMVQSGDLIGIRSRGSEERPLPELSERAKAVIRFVNILAVAGLVLLIGTARLYLRRRKSAVRLV